MSRKVHPLPAGHVLIPAIAIGSLALVLAGGLGALGFLGRMDHAVAQMLSEKGVAGFTKTLPQWGIGLCTSLVAYGLSAVILSVPCLWRRLVLWISTLVLIVFWAPVLGLASHAPDISAPLIAALWSGACALVYAYQHRMQADVKTISPQRHGES